jgi:hypothetical protein
LPPHYKTKADSGSNHEAQGKPNGSTTKHNRSQSLNDSAIRIEKV